MDGLDSDFLLCTQAFAQRVYWVDQAHSKAADSNPGTEKKPYLTIGQAAKMAGPGDTVRVKAGIYRERVAPAKGGEAGKPVVYQAAKGEQVILRGSDIWEGKWEAMPEYPRVFRSPLLLSKLKAYNPFFEPLARMKGSRQALAQVFVDGQLLPQADSLQDLLTTSGSWMLSYDSTHVLVHFPSVPRTTHPSHSVVEYSVRGKVFAPHQRGLGYITVEGFIIEHCANQFPSGFYNENGHPQAGALSTRSGHHWVIRYNTIRLARSLAIDCGYEGERDLEGNQPYPPLDRIGYHLIEHNWLTDNGAGGIAGANQHQTIIRYNTIERSNTLGHTAPETGGIKVHFFYNGLIEGNILRDNHCAGIWLDNQWYRTRVTRNVVLGSSGSGIFVEMGEGPCLVDNNIVAFTKMGDGIYMHDASGVTVAHNFLFANDHFGLYTRIVTDRKAGNAQEEWVLVACRDLTIKNNIFMDNYRGHMSFPLEDGDRIARNTSDYNLLINGAMWHWEGLAWHRFNLQAGGAKGEKVWEYIQQKHLAQGQSMAVDKSTWQQNPLLSLKQWQVATGNDQHSFVPSVAVGEVENGAIEKGAFALSVFELRMLVNNPTIFQVGTCPPLPEVAWDFYGHHLPKGAVLPGPFQHFDPGINWKLLYPSVRQP